MVGEISSMMSKDSWLSHFEAQNTLDFISISYLCIYTLIRIALPFGSMLNYEHYSAVKETLGEEHIGVYNAMPVMHVIAMILMVLQVFYFFKVLDFLSKYVQLIYKGIRDAAGFLMLFVLFEVFFAVAYHVLGANMDGGNDYEISEETDGVTFSDKFPFMDYWIVCYLSAFQTSIGIINQPSFRYWI